MKQPNWGKVACIFRRELRDQLRDRRTLFIIAVLPLLLYPLLSMGLLQIAQFLKRHPSKVLLLYDARLPSPPDLVQDGRVMGLSREESDLFQLEMRACAAGTVPTLRTELGDWMRQGLYDLAVWVPRDASLVGPPGAVDGPSAPQVFYCAAKDRSRMAHQRMLSVLREWNLQRAQRQSDAPVVESIESRFQIVSDDLSDDRHRRAALWSKILPFVVFIWALTGAFYPAIDLCAGEKERGTLETLLASAAERLDIVWGKLLTTMLFSAATALLNMICMVATASYVTRQFAGLASPQLLPQFGPPSLAALTWVLLALLPITALFGSLALALAALARSTKEGQYYLMPLILGFTPLMMLAMVPSARLDLGNSLLPVTGLMLLLRHVMEGEFQQVWLYAIPVMVVTVGCCLLSIRWAVDQFSNEQVLFRSSERFRVWIWLKQLMRERGPTPSLPEAVLCGMLILMIRFFAGAVAGLPATWNEFVHSTTVALVAFIAAPPLLMTLILTSSPRQTLLLRRPPRGSLLAAAALAVCLHPLATALIGLVRQLYPLDESLFRPLERLFASAPSIWDVLLLMAVLPALCEEIAFRGFILSGLRQTGMRWRAIALSSLLFGLAHGVLQQSLIAGTFGLVLGYLAVSTNSLFPCIVFHASHNALGLLASDWLPRLAAAGIPGMAQAIPGGSAHHPSYVYGIAILFPSLLAAGILLNWFRGLPGAAQGRKGSMRGTSEAMHGHGGFVAPVCVTTDNC